MDPLVSATALGFVLGMQHATDADHLVAVATIVSREGRFGAGALVGALWGLGHTAALGLAGVAIIGLDLTRTTGLAVGLELIVAAMLVVLGTWRLRDALRGLGGVPPAHVFADHVTEHEHGGVEALHSHPHAHGGALHRHPHLHPSRWLLQALGPEQRRFALRPLIVGAVHGMAGSAAVSLLVLATVRSVAAVVIYLALFGAGTIAGMTALTAVMAYPVTLAVRFDRARRALAVLAGAGSIAFGIFYGYRVI
jgi:ABC-type nickel/cobalt efflux system permease component RcnA